MGIPFDQVLEYAKKCLDYGQADEWALKLIGQNYLSISMHRLAEVAEGDGETARFYTPTHLTAASVLAKIALEALKLGMRSELKAEVAKAVGAFVVPARWQSLKEPE